MILMLDLRFTNLCLVLHLIGCEQTVVIVKESLYPILSKCDHTLHPLVEFESGFANQRSGWDYNSDIFKMIINTSESMKKVVNKELLIFKQYQVDVRISNIFFNNERSMKTCFLLLLVWLSIKY